MAASNVRSDAVINTTQLVQYDDDDDVDETMKSSHSQHLGNVGDAELDGGKDELDRAGVDTGENRMADTGSDYQEAIDGNGGSNLYVEPTHGQGLQADALGVYCTYETAASVVPGDGVGTGHDYSNDLQERIMEETVQVEEPSRVNAENHDAYLPEDPIRSEGSEHSSFSSIQQLQLRAQILVYGDLIKGILPEESLMSSAFSDEGGGPDQSSSGWNWERTWQIAAEKEAERRESEGQEEEIHEDDGQGEKGDAIVIEENVVASGPNTPSGSPLRKEFTVTMPQGPAGIVDPLVANVDGQTDEGGDVPAMLSANLDVVVQTIVAATASVVDGSGIKDTAEFQSTRSPSLDPWLKPQLMSQGTPAPGPVLAASSPITQAVPINQMEPENTPSNIPAVAGTPEKQPSKRKGRSSERKTPLPTNVEEAESGQGEKDDRKTLGSRSEKVTGGKQRKGRGRKAQSPKALDTPPTRGKTRGRKAAGNDLAESTPPLESPKGKKIPGVQSTPRRGSRAKSVTDTQVTLDSAKGTMPGTSSQRVAGVPDGSLSPGSLRLGKGKEKEDGSDLHTQTQTWLEQAKVSFNEAFAAANSAAEQKEFVESVTTQANQTPGKDSNQSASVAAAVYAAASVAKAAAEAAKVAYHAALQATCIVTDGYGDSGGKIGVGSGDRDGGLGSRRSAIAAAKEEARKRPAVTSPSKTAPQSTDAVLRAARLMAEAASEAGAVLAKGNATAPLTSPESPVTRGDGSRRGGGRGRPGKGLLSLTSPAVEGNGSPSKLGGSAARGVNTDIKESLKKGARRVAKAGQGLDSSESKAASKGETTASPPEKLTRRSLVHFASSPSHAADVPEVLYQDQIVEGSLVEVMDNDPGLRGVWFSGKVLELKSRDAFVQYDEILTDDGSAPLKEWFPLDVPSGGTEGGRPRIRPMSPKNIAREGRRKRRRTSTELLIWAIGDRVDAYDKDGWWEGIIKAIDENDETKITIHFPAENTTSILKSWNLRPSLFWKEGRWEQWIRDGGIESKLEDSQSSKKRKANQSPKVQARKPGRKTATPGKAPDEAKENSRSSRRLKELGDNAVASPAIVTRSSPRQITQKKDGRSRATTREAAEV